MPKFLLDKGRFITVIEHKSSRRTFMNERIQKAEASKEIDEETQNQASTESPRMAMMQRNTERNNARENVISTSQKKGRSR